MAPSATVLAKPVDSDGSCNSMTAQESKRLAACEVVIERGIGTFAEVGKALAEIRDKRLYRTDDPKRSFADYCRERWDMTRTNAYYLIDASHVTNHLSTMVDIPPANERQCRPLTTIRKADSDGQKVIDLEQVGTAWEEVIERAEKDKDGQPIVTAAHVKETVDQWKAVDEPYREPKFDFDKASDRLETYLRATGDTWPEDDQPAYAQILRMIAKEFAP